MNIDSFSKSVIEHFARMPLSPTSSVHEQSPVQLSVRAALV